MSKKRIIVADDDPGIVDAMKILLEDEGYEVITTGDGSAVHDLYDQKPDLVFLDLWMSGINGNDVCRMLKSKIETKEVPIIIFSANRDLEVISKDCGANDFLPKPFDIDQLICLVNKYLGNENPVT